MDLGILFERTRSLWPEHIDISRKGANDDDAPFWSLVETYERIEGQIKPDDSWMEVSAWAFHQALIELAEESAARNINILHVLNVPMALFDRFLRENLSDASWESERIAYVRQNGLNSVNPT